MVIIVLRARLSPACAMPFSRLASARMRASSFSAAVRSAAGLGLLLRMRMTAVCSMTRLKKPHYDKEKTLPFVFDMPVAGSPDQSTEHSSSCPSPLRKAV